MKVWPSLVLLAFAGFTPDRTLAATTGVSASTTTSTETSAEPTPLEQRVEELEKALQELKKKPVLSKVDGGLRAESADGQYKIRLFGRMHADAAFVDEDQVDIGSSSEFRRARIGIRGSLPNDFDYKFEVDFGGGGSAVKDWWLGYRGWQNSYLYLGNSSEFFSAEEYMTSNHIVFMERSFAVDVFAQDRDLGVAYSHWGNNWSIAFGAYGDGGAATQPANGANESSGVATRLTFAPYHVAGNVLHFGLSTMLRDPQGDSHRLRTRPNSHPTSTRLVDTGRIDDVSRFMTNGIELIWAHDSISVQAEYARQAIDRGDQADLEFAGWYLQASWVLTGEQRGYDVASGVQTAVIPTHENGAWELGLRYDTLELNDADIAGGEQRILGLALNWYPNSHVRFMGNLLQVEAEKDYNLDGLVERDKPVILQFRAQVYF